MEDAGDGGGGLCLCQTDAYLRSLDTTVVSCTSIAPTAAPAPPAGKGKSKATPAAAAAPPPPQKLYAVILEQTPMFPESGGQPSDQGQLVVTSSDGGEQVVNVLEVSWHEGVLRHVTNAPLEPGTRVTVRVDWRRRYDHMQQHTGQHVLSAVAEVLYGAATVSWELHPLDPEAHGGGDYGLVVVELSTPYITTEQLCQLEAAANAELRAGRRVEPLVLDPASPEDLGRMAALQADPCFRGKLPPPDKVKGGKLRLVQVEGLDINACGGTHVRSTGEVQVVKLAGAPDRTRGNTRVRFMCGDRALAALAGCLAREAALTVRLTVPPARHEDAVDALLRDRRDGAKARKLLAAELAALLGRDLAECAAAGDTSSAAAAATASAASTAAAPTAVAASVLSGKGWAAMHRPAADLDFLALVANAALEADSGIRLLLLTADDSEPGALPVSKAGGEDSLEVTFLVAGQPDLVKAAGPRVAEALGGRGGGRPGRYQGKAAGTHRLPAARRTFEELWRL